MCDPNNWSAVAIATSSNRSSKAPDQRRRRRKDSNTPRSRLHIPLVYRIWHLWLEPWTALGGVYHLHWAPERYFEYMPRTSHYAPESQIVYDQLASSYLFFALNEALVLRITDDVKVWKAVVFALLVCDAGHIYATWVEMGTLGFFSPWLWQRSDVVTMVMNFAPLMLRVAFLLDAGREERD